MMQRLLPSFLLIGLLPLVGSCEDNKKDPTKSDKGLKELQGTWMIIAHGSKGRLIRPVTVVNEAWGFEGNKLTYFDNIIKRPDDLKLVAEIKVDSSKNPAHIDFTMRGERRGKKVEQTTYGIYSLKGDELRVCVPEKFDPWEPENRPTKFESTAPPRGKNSGFSVYVLKRKK